ncbi:hypothetical protein U0070_025448, partial [Myodes glareolus]
PVQMALSQNNSLTPELLLATAIFCIVFYVVKALRTWVPKGLKSPPGPWGWSIIGHIADPREEPTPYGDVLQIRIDSTPVMVLSGLDTIQQALVKQGDDFKGRPDLYSFTFITDGQSLTFNPGTAPVWAVYCRLAMDALKSFSIASDLNSSSSCYLEEHVSQEANHLVSKFQKQKLGTSNLTSPQKSEDMLSLLKSSSDFVENVSSGNAVDFFPILCYLPNPALKRFKNFNDKFLLFLQKTVQEHYQDFNKNSILDVTGALFVHTENSKDSGVQIPHKKIVNIVNDLFSAGRSLAPTPLSISGYLPIPSLFTNTSTTTMRDTSLNDFHIPKEHCIFINQWQVNHD